jgi:hypothetical protein
MHDGHHVEIAEILALVAELSPMEMTPVERKKHMR